MDDLPPLSSPSETFETRTAEHLLYAARQICYDLPRWGLSPEAEAPNAVRCLRTGITALTGIYDALTKVNGNPADDDESLGGVMLRGRRGWGQNEDLAEPLPRRHDIQQVLSETAIAQRKAALATALERARRARAPDDVRDALENELRETLGLSAGPMGQPSATNGAVEPAAVEDPYDNEQGTDDPDIVRCGPLGLGERVLVNGGPAAAELLIELLTSTPAAFEEA